MFFLTEKNVSNFEDWFKNEGVALTVLWCTFNDQIMTCYISLLLSYTMHSILNVASFASKVYTLLNVCYNIKAYSRLFILYDLSPPDLAWLCILFISTPIIF